MEYHKVYHAIIEKAKKENRVKGGATYYEAHHILPKCLGGDGTYRQWSTHPNLVLLTAREHFICHRLLCKMYPGNASITAAYWGMCNQKNARQEQRYVPTARAYEEGRVAHAEAASARAKANITQEQIDRMRALGLARKGEVSSLRGTLKGPRPDWVKQKISESSKGKSRPKSEAWYEAIVASNAKRRGVTTHNAQSIKHVSSGITYPSVQAAAKAVGKSSKYIKTRLQRGEYRYL